jgi:hypothetical protein
MATFAIKDVAIVLNPGDDVAIAKREIPAGSVIEDAGGRSRCDRTFAPGTRWPATRAPRGKRCAAMGRSSASRRPTSR